MSSQDTLIPVESDTILCVEMHTTGEPTRIVYSGFPPLAGKLMEQRAQAKRDHDHIRRRLILEPRGHWDMYGALLCRRTELTEIGEADIGVLFMHNEGFSTMCGHATIALGRFLVDNQHNKLVFADDPKFKHETEDAVAFVRLHAPCGLVMIKVPIRDDGRTDISRPIAFVSVPSFATALAIQVDIPAPYRWPELADRERVTVDFSYGGAFYCIVPPEELGFAAGLRTPDVLSMKYATEQLKAAINDQVLLRRHFHHPDSNELGFLYSIMLVDKTQAGISSYRDPPGVKGSEVGLCFFADGQIDRSPTGGCVTARIALAFAKGEVVIGDSRCYHSLLSSANGGVGSFTGTVLEEMDQVAEMPFKRVKVQVEGKAHYTGLHTFVAEEDDVIGRNGFKFL